MGECFVTFVFSYGGPQHVASEGAAHQQVSLQECAPPLLDCADLRAAANAVRSDKVGLISLEGCFLLLCALQGLSSFLAEHPALAVSALSLRSVRANVAALYTTAAAMEVRNPPSLSFSFLSHVLCNVQPPFDEALDALSELRALSGSLVGIAEEFARLNASNLAASSTSGLAVWSKARKKKKVVLF